MCFLIMGLPMSLSKHLLKTLLTEVDNLQGVPPTEGEGETMVTP